MRFLTRQQFAASYGHVGPDGAVCVWGLIKPGIRDEFGNVYPALGSERYHWDILRRLAAFGETLEEGYCVE